jgi:flagellar basal-body rod protein FlgG
MSAIYSALAGINVQRLNMETVAGNMANGKTIGYKSSSVASSDAPFYNYIKTPGAQLDNDTTKPVGVYTGNGSLVSGTLRNLSQGELKVTNNPLDFLINGSGYVSVDYKGQRVFTRNGQLQVSRDRILKTIDGYTVNEGNEITIPEEVSISTLVIQDDGVIYGQDATGARVDIGQITVFNFDNEQGLKPIGGSFLQKTDASGDEQESIPGENGAGSITHKALEGSNVNLYEQMMTMLEASQSMQHLWSIITRVHKIESDSIEATYMKA